MVVTKLELTNEQMTLLNMALIELPFKVVAPLIQSINEQIATQKKEEE